MKMGMFQTPFIGPERTPAQVFDWSIKQGITADEVGFTEYWIGEHAKRAIDAGYDACRDVVVPWFADAIEALPPLHKLGKDAKTRLQEWLQARQAPLPVYTLLAESGEDHAKSFRIACALSEPAMMREGDGASRRAAEQAAAEAVLATLEK